MADERIVKIEDNTITVDGVEVKSIPVDQVTTNTKTCKISKDTIIIVHCDVGRIPSSKVVSYIKPFTNSLKDVFKTNEIIMIPVREGKVNGAEFTFVEYGNTI